jgi:hypothetical protein
MWGAQGNSPHTLEVGAGMTYVGNKLEIMNFYNDKQSQLFGTFSFMYRRHPRMVISHEEQDLLLYLQKDIFNLLEGLD